MEAMCFLRIGLGESQVGNGFAAQTIAVFGKLKSRQTGLRSCLQRISYAPRL